MDAIQLLREIGAAWREERRTHYCCPFCEVRVRMVPVPHHEGCLWPLLDEAEVFDAIGVLPRAIEAKS